MNRLQNIKNCCILSLSLMCATSAYAQNPSIVLGDTAHVTINKNIYGQFAEHLGRSIYDGFYRNEHIRMDIVDALKEIRVPNLRWPGGCFADQYHWRDGVGTVGVRPKTVNTTWGMVPEDNSFGTDEFFRLCKLIGCEPYVAGNVGTGTVQEMKDWVEYLNYNGVSAMTALRAVNGHPAPYGVSLWGVGNESWGCGGNMTPEHYADLYKQYAAFLPDYPGHPLKTIISGANADDYHWTEVMMKNIDADGAYGLSLHYYTFPTGKWNPRGSATNFTEAEYFHTLKEALRMQEIVEKHSAIMNKYDPQKKMALIVDEWGVWTDVEPGTPKYAMCQQNSLRDALIAATTLNIFNNHADRVRGANLAQAVNVIQSLVLTKGDSLLLTPTYWVFDLYKAHQDAKLLPLHFESPLYKMGNDSVPAINASASMMADGSIHITLVNLDPVNAKTITAISSYFQGKKISAKILTSAKLTDCNSFANPHLIKVRSFDEAKMDADSLTVNLPAKSIVALTISK